MESRTERLKQRLLESPFELCAERAVLWTESQKQTAGRPQVLRNALALDHLLSHMTVTIYDDELIVGHRTSKRRGAPLFPETKSFSIEAQLDTYETRAIQPYRVGDQERRAVRAVMPYWRGRSVWELAHRLMPRDIQADVYKLIFTVEAEFANGIGHFIVGNPSLLAKGFAGIREDAQQRLRSLTGPEKISARHFLHAVIITSHAAIKFARRYAQEARRLAAKEKDQRRNAELLRIAEICDRVPENPPRDFYEALQAIWLNQLICQLECGGFAISPGRLDQLLHPFFVKDREQGKITAEQAQELIECLYVKMSGVVNILDTITLPVTSGPPIAQSLTIAGTDAEGRDATNDLTCLFIDALDHIRTVSPNMAVRFHSGTPQEFTRRVCDAVRRGTMMALFNDECIVPALINRGIPEKEARDYAIVGCVEPAAAGSTFGSTDANLVNIARCLELALHNGDGMSLIKTAKGISAYFRPGVKNDPPRDPALDAMLKKKRSPWPHYIALLRYLTALGWRTNLSISDLHHISSGKNLGVQTGDPSAFQSIDDLLEAFRKQVAYFVRRMTEAMYYCDVAHAQLKPTPFISSTIDDCIAQARDVTWGGARYNFTGPQAVGLAEVADSLAAVKTLVFDKFEVSMAELIDALKNNFRGKEPLRQMLLHKAPKYGNGDGEADALARAAADIYCREVARHKNFRGGIFHPGIYSMSAHLVFGILTGATPDGRHAGETLAAGVSPHRGRETKGPTAVLRSASQIDNTQVSNGSVLNMSFDPQLVRGEINLQKFADLNRAYFQMGGLQVQYNIIDEKILRDAQEHPDRHRGLVVRVAGYSALFTELDRATQNDIIRRTLHGCEVSSE